MLPIHLKMMDTMEEAATEAMVNTGMTGDFIDQDFVNWVGLPTCKLVQLILVYNVNGTPNEARCIDAVMSYNEHSERIVFAMTQLGKQSMILRFTWLEKHNCKGTLNQ
jgi:hypothetical protein